MATLQLHLNEYKKGPETAVPLEKVSHEAIEPQYRQPVEPSARTPVARPERTRRQRC